LDEAAALEREHPQRLNPPRNAAGGHRQAAERRSSGRTP
jgi:hypothetical protein